jgi:hypothetical protein
MSIERGRVPGHLTYEPAPDRPRPREALGRLTAGDYVRQLNRHVGREQREDAILLDDPRDIGLGAGQPHAQLAAETVGAIVVALARSRAHREVRPGGELLSDHGPNKLAVDMRRQNLHQVTAASRVFAQPRSDIANFPPPWVLDTQNAQKFDLAGDNRGQQRARVSSAP